MALFSVRNILTGLFTLIAIVVAQTIVLKSCDYQTKALILRTQYIFALQAIMLLFSFILWRNFRDMPVRVGQVLRTGTETGSFTVASRRNLNDCNFVKLSNEELVKIGVGANSVGHRLWKLSLLFYLCLCHFSYVTNIFLIDKEPHWFGMLSYSCLGSFIQLNTGWILFKCLSFVVRAMHRVSAAGSPTPRITNRVIGLLALMYMIFASLLGLYTASQPPSVKPVEIPVKDLPVNLHGLTIVQLSDIHLGPTVGFSKLQMIVDIVNKERPDVIVLTGDLVDGKVKSLRSAAEPLTSLNSRYGKFFVTGNHEYHLGDVDNWFTLLRSFGFTVLHNSNVRIPAELDETEEGQICLAGTDDLQADKIVYGDHRFDLDQALSSCSTALPVVLLAHQPKAARLALDSNYRVDLVLSGHTHGGQMFPLMLGAYLLNPFYAGLYSVGENGSHVYVSKGTQYWGIPMRIGASMEITRITLVPTDDQDIP